MKRYESPWPQVLSCMNYAEQQLYCAEGVYEYRKNCSSIFTDDENNRFASTQVDKVIYF